jgi:hypothetical protein
MTTNVYASHKQVMFTIGGVNGAYSHRLQYR